MAYSFHIGKATAKVLRFDHDGSLYVYPGVEECEQNDDVWEDDMGGNRGGYRDPGYMQWHRALELLPMFRLFWEKLKKDTIENEDINTYIPVEYYVKDLDEVEKEAQKCFDGNGEAHHAAKRALWFCKYSREALRQFGDLAAFEVPGEWK